jgi:hypothetical protein
MVASARELLRIRLILAWDGFLAAWAYVHNWTYLVASSSTELCGHPATSTRSISSRIC